VVDRGATQSLIDEQLAKRLLRQGTKVLDERTAVELSDTLKQRQIVFILMRSAARRIDVVAFGMPLERGQKFYDSQLVSLIRGSPSRRLLFADESVVFLPAGCRSVRSQTMVLTRQRHYGLSGGLVLAVFGRRNPSYFRHLCGLRRKQNGNYRLRTWENAALPCAGRYLTLDSA
jgi:hypothetical protein